MTWVPPSEAICNLGRQYDDEHLSAPPVIDHTEAVDPPD